MMKKTIDNFLQYKIKKQAVSVIVKEKTEDYMNCKYFLTSKVFSLSSNFSSFSTVMFPGV